MILSNYFEKVKCAFDLMCDEESRAIFWDRFKYSATTDKRYLLDAVSDSLYYNRNYRNTSNVSLNNVLKKIISNQEDCEIAVWGATDKAMTIVELLYEFGFLDNPKIDCYYVDNDLSKCDKMFGWHNPRMHMPVYNPHKIKNRTKNVYVFIAVYTYSNDSMITEQLKGYGVSDDCIIHSLIGYEYFLGDMYLASGVMQPKKGDVFVDVGAFDMENTENFIKWNPEFEHVYAFEADPISYKNCLTKNMGDKVDIYNKGVWSCKSQLSFESAPNGELGGSRINNNGEDLVETVSLDEFLGDKKIDIIKMDIEGAELEALKGAHDIICKNKPCLTISVYHKPEDIIELPLYVREINKDYKFYLRHHTFGAFDTVMYAIDKNR